MKALLLRHSDSPFGVFGYFLLFNDMGDRIAYWPTCEEDWRGNKRNVSSIPTGTYEAKRVQSPKFGDTFEVTAVPNRAAILFHAGNTEESTEGCILLGKRYGMLAVKKDEDTGKQAANKWAVLDSKTAFQEFRSATAGLQQFPVTVDWSIGTWRKYLPEEG